MVGLNPLASSNLAPSVRRNTLECCGVFVCTASSGQRERHRRSERTRWCSVTTRRPQVPTACTSVSRVPPRGARRCPSTADSDSIEDCCRRVAALRSDLSSLTGLVVPLCSLAGSHRRVPSLRRIDQSCRRRAERASRFRLLRRQLQLHIRHWIGSECRRSSSARHDVRTAACDAAIAGAALCE